MQRLITRNTPYSVVATLTSGMKIDFSDTKADVVRVFQDGEYILHLGVDVDNDSVEFVVFSLPTGTRKTLSKVTGIGLHGCQISSALGEKWTDLTYTEIAKKLYSELLF